MKIQDSQNNIVNIEIVASNEGICKVGIPFPKGKVAALEQLALHQNDLDKVCFGQPLCYWQDGSIKWVNLGFFHSADAADFYELIISAPTNPCEGKKASTKGQANNGLQLVSGEKILTVSSEQFHFVLNLETLSLQAKTTDEQKKRFELKSLGGELYLNNQLAAAKLKRRDSCISKNLSGGVNGTIKIRLEGSFEYLTDKLPLRFVTIIELYHAAPFVKIQTTLHNPNRARHPGEIWDLGDEGSELFGSFCLDLALLENDKISYQTKPGENWHQATSDTSIIQLASGGLNWQSPVHLDRNKQLPTTRNGFEVNSENKIIHQGSRAIPTFHLSNA